MAAPDFRIIALQCMWLLTHKRKFLVDFADNIRPEYFQNQTEQILVKWALDHWTRFQEVISENSIEQMIGASEDDLEPLGIEDADIWRLYDHLEKVRNNETKTVWKNAAEFCKHQGLNIALKDAQEALKKTGPDLAWTIIDRARVTARPSEMRSVALIGERKVAIERIGEREWFNDYILTGIPKLDKFMDGGLRPGEVAVFLCPTGRGKTMFLSQIAAMGLMSGTEVAYYTLEVERDEIWLRVMSSASGAKINELRAWAASGGSDPEFARMKRGTRDQASPQQKIDKLMERLRLTGNADIDVLIRDVAMRGATLNTIFGDLEKIKAEGHDPKLIILDYADRLSANKSYDREHEGQTEIYRDLQAVSKEMDIGIWTASQSNRAGLNTADLDLGMIQGAFAKAFEATYVLAAGQNEAMQHHNEFKFMMAKARRSAYANQGFLVKYDLSMARFKYIERGSDSSAEDFDDTAEAMSHQDFEFDSDEDQSKARRDETREMKGKKRQDAE